VVWSAVDTNVTEAVRPLRLSGVRSRWLKQAMYTLRWMIAWSSDHERMLVVGGCTPQDTTYAPT